MYAKEKKLTLKWIKAWQRAGVELEKLHNKKIKHANTSLSIEVLEDVFSSAIKKSKSRPTSGLVDQQRLFNKLRK